MRLLENLWAFRGEVAMVTITPPGADALPWDVHYCADRHASGSGEKCSGTLGCRVVPSAARVFNESAIARWSSLWASVRVDCHRKFGPGVVQLLAYAVEPQRRGVIHFHVVLGARSKRERACLRYAARLIARRAGAHGWGRVDDRPAYRQLRHAGSAAVYLSKYLSKPDSAGSVRRLVLDGAAPSRSFYVSNRLTRETRCTMRNLRARRYAWVRTGRKHTCAQAERTVKVLSLHALLLSLHGTADREAARLGFSGP